MVTLITIRVQMSTRIIIQIIYPYITISSTLDSYIQKTKNMQAVLLVTVFILTLKV